MTLKRLMSVGLFALAACGGEDKKKDDDAEKPPVSQSLSPEQYRKAQEQFADSILNATSSAKAVADKMGKGYAVGTTRLRDTVAFLAGKKTDCFQIGRKTDPYLAGTVNFWINMNVVGSDVVQVLQPSNWTSAAGNLVDACLGQQAKDWKFDTTFGPPAAYIVQVQFK
jgi:hypothetical protein